MTNPSTRIAGVTSLGIGFLRHQLKKRIAAFIRLLMDWAIVILVVLAGGLGSSWYVTQWGSALTTETTGPWVMWIAAAREDADPYTRAHFARSGALPLPADLAETHTARTDSDGRALHSSCDYEITFAPSSHAWWSIAVFDWEGKLIPNNTDRYAFTSQTAAIGGDGRFSGMLSRSASPGNWLPTGGGGRIVLVFTVIDHGMDTGLDEDQTATRLPDIVQRGCR